MVDPNLLLVSWLRQAAFAQLAARGTTGSIYAVDLPDDIDIVVGGPAVVVCGRGGKSQTEVPDLINPRMQIDIWDDVFQNARVRAIYSAIAAFINGKGNINIASVGTIISCYEITPPQDMSDPNTGFARITAFYELFAR